MASAELQLVIDALRADSPMKGESVAAIRAKMDGVAVALPLPDDAEYEEIDAGGPRAEWTRVDAADPARAMLYFHGGGYTVGSIDSHRALATRLARATGTPVLNVDYRMGPEHRHPAAVEDAVAAYRHVRARGLAASSIVLAGDSAGGGLLVAAMIALRDAGDELPSAGVCFSPWFDLTLGLDSIETRAAADPMLDAETLRMMVSAYLGSGDPRAPTASPLFADPTGLPPLLIQVGDAEILLDDSREFAARASAAGVEVDLEVWPEMIHDWHCFADVLPEGREAIDRTAAWLEVRKP